MTVINQTSTVTANGNGVTTEWPYTFNIPDAASARVGLFTIATSTLDEIPDTDYSITGLGDDAGGEVTYPLVGSPIASTHRLVIWRELEYTQDTDLTNQTPYYPEVLETQLDRIVMQVQQLAAESDRSIKVTLGSTVDPDDLIDTLTQAALDAATAAAAAQLAEANAETAETNAEAALAAAQAIQASITLPAVPVALNMLRRNAGNTEYENRTPAQVAADISALRYDADLGLSVAQQAQARVNSSSVLLGHIWGLTLSNNGADATNDIDIAVGEAASTETNAQLMRLTSALTKRLDANWVVGTNQGGLDTGAIANAWYAVWLIRRSDTGVVDVLFSLSASAPTMPANYDQKRRIGWIQRSAGAIRAFTQRGEDFSWTTPANDYSGAAFTGTQLLAAPPSLLAKLRASLFYITTGTTVHLTEVTAGATGAASLFHQLTNGGQAGQFHIGTSVAQLISVSSSNTGSALTITTTGWEDTRQRFG